MKDPAISFMSVLLLLGSAQGVFLFFALLRLQKGNHSANKWLAGLLLILSFSLIDGFMTETRYFLRFPQTIGIEWPTNFAYCPLIYLYVRALIDLRGPAFQWRQLLHFIPVIVLYIYLIPLFALSPGRKALWWAESNNSTIVNPAYQIDPMIVLIVVQLAVYLFVSLHVLARHASRIKENFSALEAVSLSWLRNLIIAFFVLWVMYAFTFMFSGFFGVYDEAEYLIHLMVASAIYVMGFKGLAQPEIFSALRTVAPSEEDAVPLPIEERLLVSPLAGRLSILGIGMEAGFSSKSAFYTAFKKQTGMPPSKFIAQSRSPEDIAQPLHCRH
ncbi:MAG: AraC family transcriptional regulator [Pseudomonadota bacterium]